MFNVSRLFQILCKTLCFIWLNVSRLFQLKKKGIFPFHLLHFYSFMYTSLRSLISSHLKYTNTKNDINYLQPFNGTYVMPNANIVIPFNRNPYELTTVRKWACIFYWLTMTYGFDFEIIHCGFCKSCNWLWVLGCLGFGVGKS